MVAFPAFAASSPVMRAMLVTIAAVPPKLILVGLRIFGLSHRRCAEEAIAVWEARLGTVEDEAEDTSSVGMAVRNPSLAAPARLQALLTRYAAIPHPRMIGVTARCDQRMAL
jgi:hypothetical protein